MAPRVRQREAFWVLGVRIQSSPGKADYDDLWGNRFMPREPEVRALASGPEYYCLYWPSEVPGEDNILAGMAVPADAPVPDGLTLQAVPAATEAVFDCRLQTIGETWRHAWGEWLPGSGYVPTGGPCFECFPADSVALESPLTIHLTVAPAPGDQP